MQTTEQAIARHDKEIATIRGDIAEVRKGQDTMRTAVDGLNGSMARVLAHIERAEQSKPPSPLDSLTRYVQLTLHIGILMGMVVTGIVYVSSNANNGEYHRIRDRLERLESGFELRLVPKSLPSAGIPNTGLLR